ncbi:phosphotransferase [Thiomicrorhabdus sp. ZW0627]|uniref:phosphotransferase n=1 Tax=Thiomicrorhabdus sp. ZW0627 TaxID=3039774 RepID=UPI00243667BD|nr:phosphotransferase [Thiomicrorhabdus sp. ZW0627]MDG6774104.1 phosphotransferase [Thiomicrorhabdus sp. ZW0627]
MNTPNSLHPYLHLSETQRVDLPELKVCEALPAKFEDSTNRLWSVHYEAEGRIEEAILKLCFPQDVKDSAFWLGMTSLFGLSFPERMADYVKVYERVSEWSPLQVPGLVAARSSHEGYAGCLLTKKLPGSELLGEQVTQAIAEQLGHHLGSLHRNSSEWFGPLFNPRSSADKWGELLFDTVVGLAKREGISIESYLPELKNAKYFPYSDADEFVPIMPDLRWDQFLLHRQRLHALVDLDAMVWGARELEFVLLEYLLDESLWQAFAEAYSEYRDLPELDSVRTAYRLLLFFMNVLGEESLEAWMSAPRRL